VKTICWIYGLWWGGCAAGYYLCWFTHRYRKVASISSASNDAVSVPCPDHNAGCYCKIMQAVRGKCSELPCQLTAQRT